LLFLLLLSPSLNYAGCGDCDEVHACIERETEIDENLHACRTCKKLDSDPANCPKFGSECEPKFYTNHLSAGGNGQCLEARCAPNAKMYVKRNVEGETDPFKTSRIRCNNSEWWVDGAVVETVICAKSCDVGACKNSLPKPSTDYTPLKLTPASEGNQCAKGGQCPNGMVGFKDDGTLNRFFEPVVTEVVCSGEGKWTNTIDSKAFKYVQCLASPCGPSKCPHISRIVPPGSDLVSLKVTGDGAGCATATCSAGYEKVDLYTGDDLGPIITTKLKCNNDGKWVDDLNNLHDAVMCKQPECPEQCDNSPPTVSVNGEPVTLAKPIRTGCDYSCPDDNGLFYYDADLNVLISIGNSALRKSSGLIGATCNSAEYIVNPQLSVKKIGCIQCSYKDGPYEPTIGEPKAKVDHCVLSCDDGYRLTYHTSDGSTVDTDILFSWYHNLETTTGFGWYDPVRGGNTIEVVTCKK
ncbi:hypothetical protein PENTCL1PPCAC_9995, partial [Pristionchus entomophagus]